MSLREQEMVTVFKLMMGMVMTSLALISVLALVVML